MRSGKRVVRIVSAQIRPHLSPRPRPGIGYLPGVAVDEAVLVQRRSLGGQQRPCLRSAGDHALGLGCGSGQGL